MKTEFQIGTEKVAGLWEQRETQLVMKIFEREFSADMVCWEPPFFTLRQGNQIFQGAFYRSADFVDVHLPEGNFRLRFAKSLRDSKSAHSAGALSSPMPGKIVKIFVKTGDTVKKGDLLMVLEAMKMEHKILAPEDGIVKQLFFQEGERIGQEVELVELGL